MCDPISLGIAAIATSAVGVGVGAIEAGKQRAAQEAASRRAEKQAAEQKAANERAINEANQKQPDLAAIMAANRAATAGGIGSTMLTGPGGVKAGTLALGKTTLLGQ